MKDETNPTVAHAENGEISLHSSESKDFGNQFIYISINKKIYKILLADILYVESVKDYITIHTAKQKRTVKCPISSFANKLPDSDFLRIHRSYIVSIKHITGFTANTIDIGDTELPVGRSYKLQVFNVLKYSPFNE